MSYVKLANSILTSTVWMEDDQTRIVWLTMLAMADKNGEIQASIPGLANIARVPIAACRIAIEKFLSPDDDSRSKDDGGRRIEEINGGWHLINYAYYRNLASDEDRKLKASERQQRFRDKALRNAIVTLESRQIPQAEAEAEAKEREREEYTNSDSECKPHPTGSKQIGSASTPLNEYLDNEFEKIWGRYPIRDGKKGARNNFMASVKTEQEVSDINKALDNYLAHLGKQENSWKRPKNGDTWFNNWRDSLEITEYSQGSEDLGATFFERTNKFIDNLLLKHRESHSGNQESMEIKNVDV